MQDKLTNVFIVADCSGSMAGDLEVQMRRTIREAVTVLAEAKDQRFQVQLCPFSNQVALQFQFSARETLNPGLIERVVHTNHPYGGGTALLDAIGRCVEEAEKTIHTTPALVMVFTDGAENASRVHNSIRLQALVERVEKTGNLTLTVAGPKSVGAMMGRLGLKADNFRSWDGTEKELRVVAAETKAAVSSYVTTRSSGGTRSDRFYADASAVTPAGLKANTARVTPTDVAVVTKRMAGRTIADYFGAKFVQGTHFYELVKAEYVQEDKDLIVLIKADGEYRIGSRSVRTLLGLPETGRIRVHPSTKESPYTIYVRSESNNRKVVEGQKLLTVGA